MDFTKLQGAGNDFILIESGDREQDWSHLARQMCDRHFGIGGDGLLLLLPSNAADFAMRMFNPDGSEAEACGNGLRCFARYVWDKGLVDAGSNHISIGTVAGQREASREGDGDGMPAIRIGMGIPRFGAADIPLTLDGGPDYNRERPILDYPVTVAGENLLLGFVSLGNPHAVHFLQQPVAGFPLAEVGPELERHRLFPERINFAVAHVISRQKIDVRVWERGAGETLACGTGACAVTVIAQLKEYSDAIVDIKIPGGTLRVQWDGVGEVYLSGPAEIVFSGQWPEPGLDNLERNSE